MKKTLLCSLIILMTAANVFAYSYDLNLINGTVGISGPYVRVDVSLVDSTSARLTFTTLVADEVMFGEGAVGFNLNGALSGISIMSTAPAGKPANTVDLLINSEQDGWGRFDYALKFWDGPGNGVTSITLLVTLASGSWASDAVVLDTNTAGHHAEAHVWLPTGGEGSTWFVTDGPVNVPEPATLLLLGLGLIGLAGAGRKVRK